MHLLPRSLRSRLLFGATVPVVLFLLAAVVAALALRHQYLAQRAEAKSHEVLTVAQDVRANLALMQTSKRAHHLIRDPEQRARYEKYKAAFTSDLEHLQQLTVDYPEQSSQVAEVHRLSLKWQSQAEDDFEFFVAQLLGLPEEQRLKRAKEQLLRMMPVSGRIYDTLTQTINTETTRLAQRKRVVQRAVTISVWASLTAFSVAVILAILIPFHYSRWVSRPIEELKSATDRLRQGNFTTLRPNGPQEIATLTSYFNMMGLALSSREDVLRAEQRRYQGLVGSMTNLLWSMDGQGNLRDDFISWTNFTGQQQEGVQGEGWLEAVHPDERDDVTKSWRKAIQEKALFQIACRLRRHDGVYRDFQFRCIPLFDGNEIQEWVCACNDTTEQKQQEQLRRQMEAAEAASQAKSQFLARMSHELRTPLNAIIGMSKMLQTQRFGRLNEKQSDYLHDVISAGKHLLDLINDVLDISRVEAGQLQVQFDSIPVGETLDAVVSPMKPLAAEKKQKLNLHVPEPDGEIETDLGRFKQVLINLLSNAVKFTPPKGSITVRAFWVKGVDCQAEQCGHEDAFALRVEVEDTGVGIPLEEQEEIWNEFRQASTREKTTEGTGLGLALARRLVQLLGGIIGLDSEEGKGSCFYVIIPKVPAHPGSTPEPLAPFDQARQEEQAHKSLALIVEDHEPTNKMLVDWLLDAGLRTASATDGAEGLEMARRARPQVIMLDLNLPQMDGWQVLQELKSDPVTESIPVMIISASETEPGDLDIIDWLVKPFDRADLLARLRAGCPHLFDPPRELTALVVDDEEDSRAQLTRLFEANDLRVIPSSSAEQALTILQEKSVDVLVVDFLMPVIDGFELIEKVRSDPRFARLPIIVVSGEELSEQAWQRLSGQIQEFQLKSQLTSARLRERLGHLKLLTERE